MFHTYSFANQVRDLSNEFDAIRQASPVLLSLLRIGAAASNVKHEWLEDKLAPKSDAINNAAGYLANATEIVVDDESKFEVGMLIAAEGSFEVMKVTAVTANTHTLTVTRGYGSSTAAALSDNQVIKIISKPRLQGTDPGDDAGQEPSVEYNYTQIFDRTAKVSRTGQIIKKYGIEDALNYEVSVQMDQLMRDLNNSLIYGRRVASSAGVPSSMGGLLQFLAQTGANKSDASAADLTPTMLNNLLESIYTDGGKPSILLCNTMQARKITAFNSSTSNYTVQQDSKIAGNQVIRFMGDLPMGVITDIVVDINMPRDVVMILDPSRLELNPLDGSAFKDEDARLPGADYFARRILGEYTMTVKNAKEAHGMLYNLKTT